MKFLYLLALSLQIFSAAQAATVAANVCEIRLNDHPHHELALEAFLLHMHEIEDLGELPVAIVNPRVAAALGLDTDRSNWISIRFAAEQAFWASFRAAGTERGRAFAFRATPLLAWIDNLATVAEDADNETDRAIQYGATQDKRADGARVFMQFEPQDRLFRSLLSIGLDVPCDRLDDYSLGEDYAVVSRAGGSDERLCRLTAAVVALHLR